MTQGEASSSRGRPRPAAHPRSSNRRFALSTLAFLLTVAAISVLVVRPFVLEPFYIPSASMEPTLHGCPGCEPDRVMVDKMSYRFREPTRGEVVVFNRPTVLSGPDDRLIKRVIGLPGETISGHDGSVWIGDRRMVEPYVNPTCLGTADFAARVVPDGQVFLMGDNRCDSMDSRIFGPVSIKEIVGRAFLIVWPPSRVHKL